MKRLIAALAALFLLASCAAGDSVDDPPDQTFVEPGETADGDKGDDRKDGSDKKKGKEKGPGGGKSSEEGSTGGGDSEGSGSGGGNEGDSTPDESDNGSDLAYPAAGTYTFTQEGYEEFCDQAGRCDKEDLPARLSIDVSYEKRSGSSALAVSDQEGSGSRHTRTWTRFTSAGAHVTKVYVEFDYSGFRFERTYVPQPAVEALRFPLTAGESWSGRWEASTSGSYSADVGRPRSIEIGGKTVRVFPVDTVTEFRGDFNGKSRLVAYIDSETNAIVATDGVLNVTSNFGRYSTLFETELESGPGY